MKTGARMRYAQRGNMKTVLLKIDYADYLAGQVITVSDLESNTLINSGSAELIMSHDEPSQPIADLAKPDPVPSIPENLPEPEPKRARKKRYRLIRDLWQNEGGRVVRISAGEYVFLTETQAERLLTFGAIQRENPAD